MVAKYLIFFISLWVLKVSFAQSVAEKLEQSVLTFEKDAQLENAIFSLYVIDANTGEKIFAKNENIGLSTASCLKVVTSATAMEVLGKEYQFVTKLLYTGSIDNGILNGNLIIQGSGDPTLGSWRWEQTKTNSVLNKMVEILKNKKIQSINGKIIIMDGYHKNVTPSNWIWEDLGNYYGAPARLFNWRENQYDLHFATGKNKGDKTTIIEVEPELPIVQLSNEVATAETGTGDNTVIYLPPFGTNGTVKGTLPANENKFTVSGSMPNPTQVFVKLLQNRLRAANIKVNDAFWSSTENASLRKELSKILLLDTLTSPTLDKINYWFMKKSINLYGETFLNKMGEKKQDVFLTKNGVEVVKAFWQQKGISAKSLNIYDGSGLSPANRVTTKTLVTILQYAQKQNWFDSYYEAFPLYNEMKLKSGTIGDVKGFSGYHISKDGKSYIISFLVNNYDGSSKALVGKMFKVLDVLK